MMQCNEKQNTSVSSMTRHIHQNRAEGCPDHCVEYIREALMCQPDLSLVTFRWINNTAQHPDDKPGFYPTNFDVDVHTCANWKALDSWASERMFNLFEVDQLQRPNANDVRSM